MGAAGAVFYLIAAAPEPEMVSGSQVDETTQADAGGEVAEPTEKPTEKGVFDSLFGSDEPTSDKVAVPLQGGAEVEVPPDSPAARMLEAKQAREAAKGLEANQREAAAMNNPGPMGPDGWAAPISPEEEAEIQAAFDALPEPDPRVTRRDRKTSIEVARVVVEDCYRELQRRHPGRRGRIAVAWTAMANEGQGTISEPEITLNLRLREMEFEACIEQGLDGLTFPADDQGEPLRVEYPFMFDK